MVGVVREDVLILCAGGVEYLYPLVGRAYQHVAIGGSVQIFDPVGDRPG